MIQNEFLEHINVAQKSLEKCQNDIQSSAKFIVDCLKKGNKILLCGNGGSAADAQHIAAELTGRYKTDRIGLPAIALTTDTSALSAIANDFGYDIVFARQVEALAKDGDVLIGISTSGNSTNVIHALKQAKEMGCICIGFSGKGGGEMDNICDINISIPSDNTPRIQEMHILIGHILCDFVDKAF